MRFNLLVALALLSTSLVGGIPPLMPYPQKVNLREGKFVLGEDFGIKIAGPYSPRVFLAKRRFLSRLAKRTGIFFSLEPQKTALILKYQKTIKLKPKMDESYRLEITPDGMTLEAKTDIGILRGIETLLQLLSSDSRSYFFPAVSIEDSPRFPWRGLLIDTVRHFMPVEVLKRNIDAMAAVKMNVLHLHLSDDQGFRLESKKFPLLHLLASDGNYYTQQQMRELIKYADLRGIRIVPEFDIPGHTTSWLVAYPELATLPGPYALERTYGTKDPVMDPTKKNVYKFLKKFFKEVTKLFPDQYIHIGGDEVNGVDWSQSERIKKFMEKHHMEDFSQLQAYFNQKVFKILKKLHKKPMGWDEILHETIPRDVIIQSWRGKEAVIKAVKQGFNVVVSAGYYIDLCHSAAYHYLNDPIPEGTELTEEEKSRILGGEATMWSELVDRDTVDSRIWPRTAAIAERLWSPSEVRNVRDMYLRLRVVSRQLEELGLTHIKNQGMLLRRIARYQDIKPLEIFLQAVEPIEGYERHDFKDYTVFSPLSRMVDASVPDPIPAVLFNFAVEDYLNGDENAGKFVVDRLNLWWKNHQALEKIAGNSPVLKEVLPLSSILSRLSYLSLQVIEKGNQDENVLKEAEKLIQETDQPCGELKLAIIESFKKILFARRGTE